MTNSWKRIVVVIVALLTLYGAWGVGQMGVTFYKDYQEFKAIRLWVRAKVQAEQRARQAPPAAQPAPQPAPAAVPEPPR